MYYTSAMKLTAIVKLLPTDEQRQTLRQTLERANAACNWISLQAWDTKTFNNVALHHLTYYPVREQFALSAQVVVHCIGKVSDAYKLDKKVQRTFKPHGAIAFDSRILTWHIEQRTVSIWTLDGRAVITFQAGESHIELLKFQQGESDLVYCKGAFYLYATCDIPDATPIDPEGFLGADMGIKNILADSDGTIYSAKHLLNVRHRHRRLRKKLHSWSFAQLRATIGYKAAGAGVRSVAVDARYTSQQCSCCGHTSRSNRPNQATFSCVACGFACHADLNAARVIASRAAVNPPYAVCILGFAPVTTASP